MRGEEILGLPVMVHKMWSTIAQISPSEAKLMLLAMPGQRILQPTYVADLAVQMKAGKWQLMHQGIAFDTDGLLDDGQHRLNALIEADMTLPFMVTFNVPADAFSVMDRHRVRKLSDDLVITGMAGSRGYSTTLASAIAITHAYDAGAHPGNGPKSGRFAGGRLRLDVTHVREAMEKHSHLPKAVDYALHHKPIMARSITAGIGALMMDAHPDRAVEFLDDVFIDDGGRIGQPADIARVILFLASEASSFVTGETLRANGGADMR